ncbi:MAG TPA: permease [Saprospiraceae bacterium]|nr:permease [Saprospiraceae bacterium]
MTAFLNNWAEAAYTSLGFFWMALWAFALGYLISSLIQVFVTEERMQRLMGRAEGKGILLGTFFGFISSSCSFSALATTKSLFQKGASFISSVAFLLASTNLVIELGIIISVFLGWQFVVGEYVGGLLLILFAWVLTYVKKPKTLIAKARKRLRDRQESAGMDDSEETKVQSKWRSPREWAKVARQYGMEWKMVWKDVTIGFTVAGMVAVFVPDAFFQSLFINSGPETTHYSFWQLLEHSLVGPVAAFMTFIGSMGNIPLAALLFGKGVSFAGVMAFIFSDLVVFPVLRINAKYYGWKLSFYILVLLLISLVLTAMTLHYTFDWLAILPPPSEMDIQQMTYFKADYSLVLNIIFLSVSGFLAWYGYRKYSDLHYMKEMASKGKRLENILKYLAYFSYAWLLVGMILYFTV